MYPALPKSASVGPSARARIRMLGPLLGPTIKPGDHHVVVQIHKASRADVPQLRGSGSVQIVCLHSPTPAVLFFPRTIAV